MTNPEFPEIEGVSYSFESRLGEGGAGKVFAVRSSASGQVYALKQIRKAGVPRERHGRFRKEIEFGKLARHDHVVRIYAHLEDENYFYYTMDLYPKSLRDIMAAESDFEVLLDYLLQLCEGLAYVHAEGIAHRDIKPENILVDSGKRRLVIADFGIAHFKDSSLTKRDDLVANRNYQAPEQMVQNGAKDVGKPSDIFALGLILVEAFTGQNSRGARHRRVGDVHPFLSEVDLLVERMTLQDATQRIGIDAVRDGLHLICREVGSSIEEIEAGLPDPDGSLGIRAPAAGLIRSRAAIDILSAKHIFERSTDEELAWYNPNYHGEMSYHASEELYNVCVQSKFYEICKAKFEYESDGSWSESELDSVVSSRKASLLRQFISVQARFPLAQSSRWEGMPAKTVSYFRFCKDYHCEEILKSIEKMLSDTEAGSLQYDLLGAPIIWIARSVRNYLRAGPIETSQQNLEWVKFERQVSVQWEGVALDEASGTELGADLFGKPLYAESIAHVLETFKNTWAVSFAERVDGKYSIHFRSHEEYERFCTEARAIAARHYVFEGDVLDLLRPEADYDDHVALVWEPIYDIRITLAKILGLHPISEAALLPVSSPRSSKKNRAASTPQEGE